MTAAIALRCDAPGCERVITAPDFRTIIQQLREDSRDFGWVTVYRRRGYPDDFCQAHTALP